MSSSKQRVSPLRTELAELVSEETGMAKAEAEEFVSRIIATFVAHIQSHEVTEIRGFGSFRWVTRKERTFTKGLFGGRTIPAYRHLKFRTAALKERNNGDR